jgi:choline dehydrogenase-like flavoprotein
VIIEANRVEPHARITTDVCIIGAGAAGITLALELSRNRIGTVLLTGGQRRERSSDRDLYRGVAEPSYPHEPLEETRRRAFGGSTIAWGGRCLPLDPIDFEERRWIPDSGWPITYADLLPHYERAMVICEAGPFSFEAAETFSPYSAPMIPEFDGPEITSARLERWSPPTNFARRYSSELRKAPRLRALVGGHAIHIQLNATGRSIEHIRAAAQPGREFFVHARFYVLAAGGLENPRLLLSSSDVHTRGIGNSKGLVGRYYMSHLMGEAFKVHIAEHVTALRCGFDRDRSGVYCRRRFALAPLAQAEREIGNASAELYRPPIEDPAHQDPLFSASFLVQQYAYAWRNGTVRDFPSRLRPDAELRTEHWRVIRNASPSSAASMLGIFYKRYLAKRQLPMVGPSHSSREHYFHYQTEHAPNRDSRVVLSGERDAFGMPRLTVRIGFSEVDAKTVVELHRLFADRLNTTKTGYLIFDEAEIRRHIVDQITHFNSGAHHLGTTRMSASSASGVVDENCKSHDVEDLYIAGSSVFATSGYANPTLTIVALSVRLAAHLRQRLVQREVALMTPRA